MTKESDTQPDPPPADDTELEAARQKEAALQAEVDAIEQQLANRRPPVYYEETSQSDGERGARYYASHEPPKVTAHVTIPDGRVILNATPVPALELATTTQPMGLRAPEAPNAGPNGTDPMWLPAPSSPATPAAMRPRIDRARETTMNVALPVNTSITRLKASLVAAALAGVVLAVIVLLSKGAGTGPSVASKPMAPPSAAVTPSAAPRSPPSAGAPVTAPTQTALAAPPTTGHAPALRPPPEPTSPGSPTTIPEPAVPSAAPVTSAVAPGQNVTRVKETY